jgi:hypothetical protein
MGKLFVTFKGIRPGSTDEGDLLYKILVMLRQQQF